LERAALKAKSYKENEAQQLYGWVENGEVLGVVGVLTHPDKIEITSIAVAENARNRGIGRSMITALREQYNTMIEAETDDDAVNFYRKCGFICTTAIEKHGVRRWKCILPV